MRCSRTNAATSKVYTLFSYCIFRNGEELGLFVRLGGYLVGEVSPIKNLRHGRRRRKMISDVLRNAKLAPIILHGRKMMGTAPASCLNLPKHFGSLYLEPVFFPHGQKPASAVSVFKQAILRYPLSTDMDGGRIDQKRCFTKTLFL